MPLNILPSTKQPSATKNQPAQVSSARSRGTDPASELPGTRASWDEQDCALLEPCAGCSWEQGVWTNSHSLPASLPSSSSSGRCLSVEQWGRCSWYLTHIPGAFTVVVATDGIQQEVPAVLQLSAKGFLLAHRQDRAEVPSATNGDSGAPLILQPFLHRFPEVPGCLHASCPQCSWAH